MLELLKNSWKMIVSIVGAIGILAIAYNTMNTVATADDVQRAKNETKIEINTLRVDTASSIKILNDQIQFNSDVQRLKTLDDMSIQLEMIILDNPKNKKAKEQREKVDVERDVLLNRITKSK